MSPDYDISLQATIFHPSERVWNITTFDPMDIALTNGTETVLNLMPLRYVIENVLDPFDGSMMMIDHSQLQLEFRGVLGTGAYTNSFIQPLGSIEFQSVPTNGHLYEEPIIFPKVFIRNAELTFDLVSTTSEISKENLVVLNEVAVWEANISSVTGPPANLSLLVELNNNAFLNITDVTVASIG